MTKAAAFLDSWISENINAEAYGPNRDYVRALVAKCLSDAAEDGLTKRELEDAAGCSLTKYIEAEMEAATDSEVKRQADKDP